MPGVKARLIDFHPRLASLTWTTMMPDARHREAKGKAHLMSPWFRWRHDVSSSLGWGGLGIPIWEGSDMGYLLVVPCWNATLGRRQEHGSCMKQR